MAVQSNNLMLLDASGLPRTIDTSANTKDSLELDVDISIGGNLTVSGDVISRGEVDVLFADAFLDLRFPSADPGTTNGSGGFTVHAARATGFNAGVITTFVAGDAGNNTAPTFTYTENGNNNASVLAAGDIVAIAGAATAGNDGYFTVASVDGNTLPQVVTIKGVGGTSVSGSLPFCQNQFAADTGDDAAGYKVNIGAVALADGSTNFKKSDGSAWDVGTFVTAYAAAATESDFTGNADWDALGSVSLQEAYGTGNSIVTANSNDIEFTLTSGDFTVNGSGAVDIGATNADVGSFAVGTNTFDIDATGAVTVDSSGAGISLDGAGASNFTTSAGALSLNGATGVNIQGNAAEIDITTTGALDLNGDAVTVDASSGMSLDAAGASNFTTSAGALTLDGAAGVNIEGNAAEIDITTTGALDLNGAAVTLDASAGMSLDAAGASNFTTSSGALTLDGAGGVNIEGNAAEIDITTTGALDLNSGAGTWNPSTFDLTASSTVDVTGTVVAIDSTNGAVTLDAVGGGVEINAAGVSNFTTSSGALTLDGAGGVNIQGNAAEIDITTTGALDLNGAAVTLDATAGMSLDAAGASNFTTSAGALSLDGAGGVNIEGNAAEIDVTTTGALDLNSGAMTLDASSMSLDATDASNLTMTADVDAERVLTIKADNTNAGNSATAQLALSAKNLIQIGDFGSFANATIEMDHYTVFERSGGYDMVAGEALAVGDAVMLKNDGGAPKAYKASNDASADDERVVYGIVAVAQSNAGSAVVVASLVGSQVISNLTAVAADIGKPVYLDQGGALTLTVPTQAGRTVFRVGYVSHHNAAPGGKANIHFAPQFIAKRPSA